jgi:RNA polymerase sigma-70 factor (ECF subfamily)
MSDTSLPARLDALLAHREWVRRVARALTSDEHLADDLEQDAWVEAISRPPRPRRSLRGWFAATLRHDLVDRRRADARRLRREETVARPESVADAADLVGDAEAHRRVVNAVMELDEPYRSTVLLRWYEDLPPRVIAERQGVPVETVRTHMKRAVRRLRELLDEESDGDRAAWIAALAPLMRTEGIAGSGATGGATGAAVGGLAMQISTKAAVGATALLLLLGTGAGWFFHDSAAPAAKPAADEAVAAAETPKPAAPRASQRRADEQKSAAPTKTVAAGAAATTSRAPAADSSAPPSVEFPTGPAAVGEVVGRVLLLPDRTPVEGAVVKLLGGGQSQDVAPFPKPSTATTGANGVFRIAGFRPGFYTFEAKAERRVPRTFNVTMPADAGVDGIEVLFGGGGSVEGRVYGANGPIAGVVLAINPFGKSGGPGVGACITDAEGRYRFEGLPADRYSVEVRSPEQCRQSASVDVASDQTSRLDFGTSTWLVGRLTDAGRPVVGAIVRVTRSAGGYRHAQAETDKTGAYRIDAIESGESELGVQVLHGEQFAVNVRTVTIAAGENHADVTFGEGELSGELSGRTFAKSSGAALGPNDVQITLYALIEKAEGVWTPGGYAAMGFADANGAFRIRCVRPGRYRLFGDAKRPGLGRGQIDVEVAYGQRLTGVELALPDAAPRDTTPSVAFLAGKLTDAEGRPMSGTSVTACSSSDASRKRGGVTDEAGRYRIDRLEPGAWIVEVHDFRTSGFATRLRETTIALGANALDLRLPIEEIAGRVIARSSKKPLSFDDVALTANVVQPDGSLRFVGSVNAATDGTFRFRGVSTGRLRISAMPKIGGLRANEIDVEVAAGAKTADVEIALDDLATGRVVFVVRDETGKAVDRFSVECVHDGRREQGSVDLRGWTDGVCESHFEVGQHIVTIRSADGGLAATTTIDAKEGATTKVDVVLRPAK